MNVSTSKIKTATLMFLLAIMVSSCGGDGADPKNSDYNGSAEIDPPAPVISSLVVSDITTGVTPQDLIETLLGPDSNVQVSNISMRGDARCAGLFSSLDASAPGFDEGIILGTGTAVSAAGPNSADDTSTEFFTAGDVFLDSLLDNDMTFDACVLEFDFLCEGANRVSVDYVMGSEEYNEFVSEGVNDVFGFGLNGTNIATIPNSGGLPVTIGNLNCGDPFNPNSPTTPNIPFCDLFNNNDLQDGGPFFNIEADGFTTVLRAEAQLQPGLNRFKFAVGDTIDQSFDTWVFLQSGSFQCDVPAVTPKNITLLSADKTITDSNDNRYHNEDIIRYDAATQEIQQYFDGSDVGLSHANVDAFTTLDSGDIIISLDHKKRIPGIGNVEARDLIRFKPTSLGVDTAGEFELFFDADKNGLVCEKDKDDDDHCGCMCPCNCSDGHGKILNASQLVVSSSGPHSGGCMSQCSSRNYQLSGGKNNCACHCSCETKGGDDKNQCPRNKNQLDSGMLFSAQGSSDGWHSNRDQDQCACQQSSTHTSNTSKSSGHNKCKNIDIDAIDIVEVQVTGTDTDTDADNDGIPNSEDACPLDSENDADSDGLCGNYTLYFSLTHSIIINGVKFDDEDIIEFVESSGSYSKYFDGSDVGIKHNDIDAIKLLNSGNILISLKSDIVLDGLGEISNEDIIEFEPTSLGNTTTGFFTLVDIDGSEIGVMSCKDLNFDGVDQITVTEQ